MVYTVFHGEVQHGNRVDEILRGYFPDYNYKGVFFDVGAYEPINISNSYHFEKNDWDVYCFEANTELIPFLKDYRKNVYNCAIYDENKESVTFHVVKGPWGGGSCTAGISAVELDPDYLKQFGNRIESIKEITVPQYTLTHMLENDLKHISKIDILSIDVEGGELKVIQGLDFIRFSPTVILVENVFERIDIEILLESYGYSLDKVVEYNQYYLKK